MTLEQELEVVRCDLGRMDTILNQPHDSLVYLDECNIFTIAHAKAHGFSQIEEYWQAYMERLEKLQAGVIFLDIPLDLSWERRQHRYQQRLVCFAESEQARIMGEYYEYLKKLRPLLLEAYERITLPKRMINAGLSKTSVIQKVSRALAELASFSTNSQTG